MTINRLLVRRHSGSSSVELPVVLFVLLILLAFPIINIATVGLRACTVFSAAREAARVAGRSKTFLADGADGPSAVNAAKQKAASIVGYAAHIDPNNVKLRIVGSSIKGGPDISQTTPLAEAKLDYVYQVEVEVTAAVDPLVTLDPNLFGNIPGLTVPFPITARNSEFAEFPAGLTQ